MAGATGALGRPLVPLLLAAGHEVVGFTRRADNAAKLDAAGARGIVCDARDLEALRRAVLEARPEAVVDLLTALPQTYDTRRMGRTFYPESTALRSQAAPALLAAAVEAGTQRFLTESLAFLYAPGEGGPRDEDAPVIDPPPAPWDEALPPFLAMEKATRDAGGTILRFGFFHGPGTHLAPGGQVEIDVRRRRFPIAGGGGGVWSFIHVDDGAAAVAAALASDRSGTYNVVDDEPAPLREWLPEYARAIGAPSPLRVPGFIARRFVEPLPYHFSTAMPGASNVRAKHELGWAPRHASWRGTFQAG